MKKIYLVHCWGGTTKDGWYPWIIKELTNRNLEVIAEDMPNTEEPTINEWVNKLDSIIENLNEDTYFIGHSIGCQTIMRYLETKEVTKIGGILFVAPWLDLLPLALEDGGDEVADEWLNTPINFEKIKQFSNNITAIFSSNDYFVSIENKKYFEDNLNAKTIMLDNKGHISQDDGIFEDEYVLTEMLNILDKEK